MRGAIVGLLLLSSACASSDSPGPPVGRAQLRLLSAVEYKNTIRDLLHLDPSDSIDYGDRLTGYDSSAGSKLDANLFVMLFNEAERLAEVWVERAAEPCLRDIGSGCVSDLIAELGRRAYRRPLTEGEHGELLALYESIANDTQDPPYAVANVVTRMLTSLHFLYRSELGDRAGDLTALTSYERASLISYAVTGSMPDDALFEAAATGTLTGDGIAAQVERLLETPAAHRRMVDFIGQWLRVDALQAMAESPADFPKLNPPALGKALRDEFAAYVERTVFTEEGSLSDLLTGGTTFINRHSAPLYDLELEGNLLKPIALGPERRGILSLASVMAAHGNDANAERDRPVKRGLLIKHQFLCEPLGLPSGIDTAAATTAVADDIEDFAELTTREQFTAIMNQKPQCKNCHENFMPFGFSFGNFDALGRYRTDKGGRPIDTAVKDVPILDQPVSFGGHLPLIDYLATSPRVSECFTRQMITYVTGSNADEVIGPFAQRLATQRTRSIPELLRALLSAPELHQRTWEAE